MKSSNLFFLVVLLTVVSLASSRTQKTVVKEPVRKGTCPVVMGRCLMLNPPDSCTKDTHCPLPKKCCEGMCGKTCMTPVPDNKPGECPPDPYRCIREESPQCANDSNCLQNKKCCYFHCGFKCVDPSSTKDHKG
ncbi:WAP four-disulfide core domain protein 5-like isoform X2 [Monodelphis domestica]|uniref:WAP four-disulfide core domain protein 5-like isoform X2 n=1 Tax=Monodelphis domestica TaxID=13616 RepID=UPI00028BDAED|nr:WAP four-disulfide core domain protein 5-like isoform X2 [Monodelphis domestica]